jgi:glycosyltransferase involved in cell wall biosynthesis
LEVNILRIAVFNALIGLAGGAEKVALMFARAFEENGYKVFLYTFEDNYRNTDEAIKMLGIYKPKNLIVLKPPFFEKIIRLSNRFMRYRKLLLAKYFLNIINKEEYDLVIDTSSNTPINVDVSYIHLPAIFSGNINAQGIHWKIYNSFIHEIMKNMIGNTRLVLLNSTWTLEFFKKIWGNNYRAHVLHPAVDIEFFNNCKNKKEDQIISVSRFTSEKRIWELVYPAKALKKYKFVFVGSTHKDSNYTIRQIRNIANTIGANNIEIITNVSKEDLKYLLCKSKYYIHPPFPEHFGISIIEAMAAGCIPLVYRNSGSYTDIVSLISEKLGYINVQKIPMMISEIDKDENKWEELSLLSKKIANKFSFKVFKEKLTYMIEKYLGKSKYSKQ